MLRILPCYAVRWKTKAKSTPPRRRKTWHVTRAPLARLCGLAASVLMFLAACATSASAQQNKAEGASRESQITHGKELFLHQWQPKDAMSPGDGLGPMFNGKSCVQCHGQGGVGGSGGADGNVDVLSVIPPRNKTQKNRTKIAKELQDIHPSLVFGTVRPSITLHKFSTTTGYSAWQKLLLKYIDEQSRRGANDVTLKITQRRAPALFGAGLINSIPDEVLLRVAAEQADRKLAPKGRLAVASDGRVGRFGWRGQTATLEQFVLGACANELGLQVAGNAQAPDPLDPKRVVSGMDMDQEAANHLVAFVSSLPPPPRTLPGGRSNDSIIAGEQVFHSVGCADCHQPKLGRVAGIYSDLLLHDMGSELADPVGANSANAVIASSTPPYYGGGPDVFADVPASTKREWRTPPLWGVANSAPYLHDGRATTLHEAILKHSGEATASRLDYAKLSANERNDLIAFLKSLGQPEVKVVSTAGKQSSW
jgi:CxxC motif-containing protein (DUF1111 family)